MDEQIDFKLERNRAGLSVSQLASITGYAKSTIHNVQNGTSKPSAEYIKAFKRAISQPNTDTINVSGRKASTIRVQRDIALRAQRLQELNDHLQESVGKLKQMQSQVRRLEEDAKVILYNTEFDLDNVPNNFNPHLSPTEEQEAVAKYICDTIVELLVEFNHDSLSDDQLKQRINNYMGYIVSTMGVRRARNRNSV